MKKELHKLVTDWDDSLHIKDGAYWQVNGITDPQAFFQHLSKIIPFGTSLHIEGLEIGLTAKSWYEEHPAKYLGKVACDTLSTAPDYYHVAFSQEFANGLCEIIKSQGLARAFYHFKAYSPTEILCQFHDAFENEFVVSNNIDEKAVRRFAASLGLEVQLAAFPHDQLEYLQKLDRVFNPPWWRRILNSFKKDKGISVDQGP